MSHSIFQIENEYLAIVSQLMENGGEASPEIEEALKINKDQLTHKSQSYGFVVKQIEGEIEIIDSEIKRLTALKRARASVIERLKNTLTQAMDLYETDEIKTPLMKINFRKSESVSVSDVELLPREYTSVKIEKTADKKAIKEAIKEGKQVPGATIETSKNIQIK